MGTRFKIIGNVELWRDEYTDAKLKPGTASELANPRKNFKNQREEQEYSAKYIVPITRLTEAIRIAPIMAQVAFDRLTYLLQVRDAAEFIPASSVRDKSLNNTVLTLYKYFNIPFNLRELSLEEAQGHWLTVEKICNLYQRALEGLAQPYKIYLYEPQSTGETTKALGFVRHAKVGEGQQHPLDTYFRTAQPDENGHIPWPTLLNTGDIHLRMDGLMPLKAKKGTEDALVARLLLHEATHKWANTKDICYKWDTIAQKFKHKEWEKAADQRKTSNAFMLGQKIKEGVQPQLARTDKAKPLLPLAKEGVAIEEWVYNADSYACAARRLWKEETNEGTKEYEGVWDD